MKNLLLLIFGFLFITIQSKTIDDRVNIKDVFANKFYTIDESGNIKYLSESDIKQMWEKKLSDEGYKTNLDKFEILTSDSEDGKTFYFLKVISKDSKIETGAFFTVTSKGMLLGDKKCTCVGCASGCNLTVFGDRCSCSACGYGGSQECKKTEETTIKTPSLMPTEMTVSE